MGIIGATGGYIGGKVLLGTISVVMVVGAAGFGAISYAFPMASSIASTTLHMAKYTALMTLYPFDSVSTTIAMTTGLLTGPI